jgi:hypothetical protein
MKMERICVLIEYKKGISWNRETKREIFKEGNIIWESYDVVAFGDEDHHNWDEIMIVDYPDEQKHSQAIEDLKGESRIEYYHVYLFEPYPTEQKAKVDMMMKNARDDPTVDLTPGGAADEVYPENTKTNEMIVKLFQGEYRGDIVIVNFIKHYDHAVYKDGHKKENEAAKETYKNYGRAAMKIQGKVGGHYDAAGKVKATIVSDIDFKWDVYVFVFYPSVDAFEQFWRSKFRMTTTTDQSASMEQAYSYIVKTYK